jgi:hypothetical protein
MSPYALDDTAKCSHQSRGAVRGGLLRRVLRLGSRCSREGITCARGVMARLDASDAPAVARTSTPLIPQQARPAPVTATGDMGATVAGEGRQDTRGDSGER